MRLNLWRRRHGCFKASETLLGIETFVGLIPVLGATGLQSLWNPFRDWNSTRTKARVAAWSFKASETLLGIETQTSSYYWYGWLRGFKASETLLGIETNKLRQKLLIRLRMLQSLWNPFRDWNRRSGGSPARQPYRFKASETLLGIETRFSNG